MWFDFTNLILLTLYFFMFGNQSQILSKSKVSFSKTSRLEKILKVYSTIQRDNKVALVSRLKNDDGQAVTTGREKLTEEQKDSLKALTDPREDFLGPTFYLMKLKKKIFIYNFTKKMQIFTYVGVQVMTAIMIFILAILHRSTMSLGYMMFTVILFMNMKQFFYADKLQRENKQWANPFIIKRALLYFGFIDVALQILYQIPFFTHQQPGENEHTRYLGFDKIYYQKD